MELQYIFEEAIQKVKDNSATICSGIAVAGVFVTAYFSGKAAVRVDHTIDPDMDRKEKWKEYFRAYWKTGLSAGLTSAAIIGSDRIHVANEMALAGVAAIWKQKAVDIDNKLKAEVGADRAKEIHKEIVEDHLKESGKKLVDDHEEAQETYEKNGKIYVYEPYTDQCFWTTRETIAWVMLEANKRLMNSYDVRLNYIIKLLGGKATPEGEKIGWNWENEVQDYAWSYYGGPWIDITPDVKTMKNGKQALCLFYMVDPETQEPEDMIYKET